MVAIEAISRSICQIRATKDVEILVYPSNVMLGYSLFEFEVGNCPYVPCLILVHNDHVGPKRKNKNSFYDPQNSPSMTPPCRQPTRWFRGQSTKTNQPSCHRSFWLLFLFRPLTCPLWGKIELNFHFNTRKFKEYSPETHVSPEQDRLPPPNHYRHP